MSASSSSHGNSSQISGKLLLRVREGRLGFRPPPGRVDELICKLEFEEKSSTCSCSVDSDSAFGLSNKDAILDVAEYHGACPIKITIVLKRGWRRDRFFRVLTRTSSQYSRQLTTLTIPMRDAVPSAHKSLARYVADAYENAGVMQNSSSSSSSRNSTMKMTTSWWSGGQAPNHWNDYWPSIKIPLSGGGIVEASILFVPIVQPEKCLGGFTELHKASYMGDARLVAVLLGPGCGSQKHSRTRDSLALTPLDIAAMRGHLDVALEIVSAHSYFLWAQHQGPDKRTSLHHAVLGGNPMLVACLAEHYGKHVFTSTSTPTSTDDTGRCLVINVEDENGWTALMMCCEKSEMVDAVTRLVESGANLEVINKNGDTALLIACRSGAEECALALLNAKDPNRPPGSKASLARPNRANHAGDRALDRAAGAKSCPTLIKALLESCAVPGLKRLDGSTALHVAAQAGYIENCKELVNWLEREEKASFEGPLNEFAGTALAQSQYFTLFRDMHGRLASEVVPPGNQVLYDYLKEVEARDALKLEKSKTARSSLDEEVYDYNRQVDEEE